MSKPAIALEKMKSLSFFKQHLYEDLLVDLMAIESWDPSTRQPTYDDEIYDVASNKWLRKVDPPRQAQPSDQEAHEEFLKLVSISEDKQTGLVSVSVEHVSADIAKRWVELMVNRVSEDLRSKDIREAEESIKFLESQRKKTSLVSLDEVFAQLIEEQTKTIMLANVSKDYVFDVIDPPVAPELKSKPSRALICVLGTLLGGMLGVVIVLIRHYGRQDAQ
jgi:capsular polysaccharide biosynthesis protein